VFKRLAIAFALSVCAGSGIAQSSTPDKQGPPRAGTLVRMPGHVPRFVSRARDLGQLAPHTILNVVLLLSRNSEQEQALQKLLLGSKIRSRPCIDIG
jgi:hypothetical protein